MTLRRAVAASLTAIMLPLLMVTARASAAPPSSPPPPPGNSITGKSGPHSVQIVGAKQPRTRRAGDYRSTTVSVRCTEDVAARLKAAGDANAAADGPACGLAQTACGVFDTIADQQQVAVEVLDRAQDGSLRYRSASCVIVGPPQITAAEVRAQVVRMIAAAAIGLAPNTATLVNIQTVMWVNAPPSRVLAPVQILGRAVRITIRLSSVDWSFGDGSSMSTRGAGKAYDEASAPCRTRECPGYFGHEYVHRGAVTVRATANWTASFTVDAGGAVTIPGTIAGPAATTPLLVKEARGVLVPNPGDH